MSVACFGFEMRRGTEKRCALLFDDIHLIIILFMS